MSLLRSWCSALSLSPDRLWRSRSLSLCSERRFPKSPSTGSRIPSEKGHFKLEGMIIDCRFTNYRLIWFRPFNLFLVSKYTKLCISLNYDLQANGSIYYWYIFKKKMHELLGEQNWHFHTSLNDLIFTNIFRWNISNFQKKIQKKIQKNLNSPGSLPTTKP